MKRRFKHSVFVCAFAGLAVSVFFPLIDSTLKRSVDWIGPQAVFAAPLKAGSSSSWNGGISGDPQFALAPYFYPSVTSPYNSQYKLGRPPLPMRPAYRQNTICNSTLSNLWVPTCDIDEAFALASTSPGYGNVGIDPTTLTSDSNLKSSLGAYVYLDINGNPRGGSTGKWDLGAYQH